MAAGPNSIQTPVASRRGRRVVEGAVIAALAATVVLEVVGLTGEFAEAPDLGVAFVGFIVAAVVAISRIGHHDRRGWLLAFGVGVLGVLGFVLTRTTSIVARVPDIDAPTGPLGPWTFVASCGIAVLAGAVLFDLVRGDRNRS